MSGLEDVQEEQGKGKGELTMSIKLEKVLIGRSHDGLQELRVDWSNDRHHAVRINHPGGPDEIAEAFRGMAMLVYNDKKLRPDR